MNIVASIATRLPDPGRTDPGSGLAAAIDAESGEAAVAPGSDLRDFGQILSDSLAKGRAPVPDIAGPTLGAATAAAAAAATDTATITATTTAPAGAGVPRVAFDPTALTDRQVPLALPGVPVITAAAPRNDARDPIKAAAPRTDALDPIKVAKTGDGDDPAADPVNADLSSQLALVSQWAGLPPAPVTPIAPGQPTPATGDGPSANGRGIKAKVDDVRATIDRTPIAHATAIDIGQVQAAVLPGTLAAAAFALGNNTRATGPSNAGTVATAKSDTQKSAETTPLTASEIRTDAVDKLFALAGVAHSATPADPSSITSQFVAQISAQVSNAQNTLGAVPTPTAAALQEPVGSGAWSHELGQTAIRMATNDLQNASLRLNPEHLGPLDVQMRIDNGIAHMQFTAAHPETRQALESSRTTLDQMFSDQGLKLGDWSVGNSSQNEAFARNFGAGSPQGDGARTSNGSGANNDAVAEDVIPLSVATRPLGLVDTFA